MESASGAVVSSAMGVGGGESVSGSTLGRNVELMSPIPTKKSSRKDVSKK